MIHILVGKRTEEDAVQFISGLAKKLGTQLPLFTSDELPHYKTALKRCYSELVPVPLTGLRGRPFKPIHLIYQDLKYATVHKVRVNQRVVKVTRKFVFGDDYDIKAILRKSTFSETVNTAGVERQNLTMRQHNRRLTRKTLGFSKIKSNMEAQLALTMSYYNFVLDNRSLYIKGVGGRTPAMAAGLTNHKWSMTELLTYRVIKS